MAMEIEVNNSVILKCRVCFEEKDDLHSIFKRRKGASAYDKLTACTKLNIEKNDGGPSLICIECLRELEITVKFLEKCVKSNEILSALDLGIAPKYESPNKAAPDNEWDYIDAVDVIDDEKRCEPSKCGVCGVSDGCEHSKYQCHLCGKQFKRKDNLKVHRQRHTGERRFSCVECGAQRYTSGELSTHMRTHATNARAHECRLCHKTFTARANLHIHMRKHTGERPHECNVCHKKFISQTTLRVHTRIHTGVKPYMCNVCGMLFASNKLSRHLRSHDNVGRQSRPAPRRPLRCPRHGCDKIYSHKQSLNKHIRNTHKEKTTS